jgi:hypothetical protein
MAFTTCSVATNNIASLDDLPNDVGGLTAAQLKAKFDQFGADFVAWFNATHIAEAAAHLADTAAHRQMQLLTNGGFEIWQRGTGPFTTHNTYNADRWLVEVAGTDTVSITREGTTKNTNSLYSLANAFVLGTGAGQTTIRQRNMIADGFHHLLGQRISARGSVSVATASAVRMYIRTNGTGGGYTYSSYHTGGGTFEELSVENALIPTDATFFEVGFFFAASSTAYLDNVMLIPGSLAADYIPLHPAEEMARCQRYYEVHGGSDCGLPALLASLSGADPLGYGVGFAVTKSVTPTLTKNGTWLVANCGQPTADKPSINGYRISVIGAAAGQAYFRPDSADDTITAEANP